MLYLLVFSHREIHQLEVILQGGGAGDLSEMQILRRLSRPESEMLSGAHWSLVHEKPRLVGAWEVAHFTSRKLRPKERHGSELFVTHQIIYTSSYKKLSLVCRPVLGIHGLGRRKGPTS